MSESESGDPPFEALAREVRRLFHQLKLSAEYLHDDPELTAAHRAMLESLFRDGPQTVPSLARGRSVSRQNIQVLVNRLLELGLADAQANPHSLRSPIIALTDAGRRRFEAMRRREHRAFAAASLPVSAKRLREATETLEALRQHLAQRFSPGEDA
jgi:DNA-binding MarR family transcriptional regulator